MRVQLLGTASADRWPNPWCDCPSCGWARAAGVHRDRTSALIDDVLLVDPGPDAGSHGADLSHVHTVLITHDHPDHLDPVFLLAWQWARSAPAGRTSTAWQSRRLVVAGPVDAVRRCEPWVRPDAPVELRPMAAADTLVTARHTVRALPAAHSTTGGHAYDGSALLFDIAAPDGRLLYATDTASLPHAQLGGPYDLVLLEETFGDVVDHGTAHLDLPSFAAEVRSLRAAGRMAPGGRIVAVHLSHHNGPDVVRRLAELGAEALPDGTTVTVGESAVAAARAPRQLLLTGGARSGKSHHAEAVAAGTRAPVTYVATASGYPDDPEWTARVAAHRARRPAHWRTLETADVASALRSAAPGACVLVDCLTLWLTAALDKCGWDDPAEAEREADAAITDLVDALASSAADLILVTNEVGSGVVPDQPSGRLFRDLLGRTNASVAAACSDVALVTAGIPLTLKGRPWPITT